MADVIMIYPKTGIDIGGAIAPPFSSMFASAILHKKKYKIKIIDQRMDNNWKKSLEIELKEKPVCIGFTTMTGPQINFALEIAKFARERTNAPFIWGGPHPTILPQQTLENDYVDIVVRGEGEEALYEIVKAIENKKSFKKIKGISYKEKGKIIHNPDRLFLDMNNLPETPWELIDAEKYLSNSLYLRDSPRTLDIGETSRGCPHRCTFCCNCAIKRHTWRGMNAKEAVRRIKYAVKKFKLTGIWIRDDNFFVDIRRVEEICKGIADLKIKWYTAGTPVRLFNCINPKTLKIIKKSGCDSLKFGGESGNNRILSMIKKDQTRQEIINSCLKCKKYDIIPAYTFMIGFPGEKYEEMLDTVSIMKTIKKEYPEAIIDALNMVTPHYGTELYNQITKKYTIKTPDRLAGWGDYAFEGENKQVWFDEKTRSRIKNMSDTSIYMENVSRVFDSIKNPFERIFLKTAMYIPKKYFQFKWKHNLFGYDPALKIMRLARRIWLGY